MFYEDALRCSALPACLLACRPQRALWTSPPTVTLQKLSTAAEVPNASESLGAKKSSLPRTPRGVRSPKNPENDKECCEV